MYDFLVDCIYAKHEFDRTTSLHFHQNDISKLIMVKSLRPLVSPHTIIYSSGSQMYIN